MNDAVFVMYNQKLKGKKLKNVQLTDLDSAMSFDDEWITEDVEHVAAPTSIDDLEIHDESNDSDNVDDDLMDDDFDL